MINPEFQPDNNIMNYVNIDLDNGLSPEQRQDSIQSRAESSITFQNI